MAPVTSDLLETTRDKIKMDLAVRTTARMPPATPKTVTARPPSVKSEQKPDVRSLERLPETPKPSKLEVAAIERDQRGDDLMQKSNKIPLRLVNECITCNICKGYLIDATTLVECLHTFCHSCIMKYLRSQDYCPKCDILVNKTKPIIKPDATLQAIVYKLVPGLYERELKRKRAFYKMCPKEAAKATPEQRGEDTEHLIFSPSEYISLSIEFADTEKLSAPMAAPLKPRYLQCPAIFRIALLKKFILSSYSINSSYFDAEIMYKVKTIGLPDHYTLMDIAYIYTWKRDAPMRFYFRIVKSRKPVGEVKAELEKKAEVKQEVISEVFVKKEVEAVSDLCADIKVEKNNNNADKVNKMAPETKTEPIKLKITKTKQGIVSCVSPTTERPELKKVEEKPPKEKKKGEDVEEEKKKSFLNAFQLAPAPKKDKFRHIAPKPLPSLKPLDKISKRKSREPMRASKKTKVSDIKEVLEKIIREKNAQQEQKESISFNLAPYPIGSSAVSPPKSTSTTTFGSQGPKPATVSTPAPPKPTPAPPKPVPVTQAAPPKPVPASRVPILLPKPTTAPPSAFRAKPYPPSAALKTPITTARPQSSPRPILPVVNPAQKRPKSPSAPEPVFKKPMMVKKPAEKEKTAPKPFTPPQKPQNYLNYALMNSISSSKNATHYRIQRTPIYSPFSPVYTPNSPQYTPNFNATPPRPQFKYAGPQAYSNLMSDLHKKSDLFPAPAPPPPKKSEAPPPPKKLPSPEDKPMAESLLNKLNFPSSLSVTLTTESDENRISPPNQKSVNNYIEIVKLPEEPESPHSPPKSIIKIDQIKKVPGENVQKDIITRVNEMVEKDKQKTSDGPKTQQEKDKSLKDSFQNKFLQSILPRLGVNEKGSAIDLFPMQKKDDKPASPVVVSPKPSPPTKTPPVASPKVSPKDSPKAESPVKSSPPSTKPKNELRKISPKPTPVAATPPSYDPAKLATMFSEFARASQTSVGSWPPQMAAAAAAASYNFNVMQQAYLLDQWSKLQKNAEQVNMLDNYSQNMQKQNANSTNATQR